MKTKKIEAEHAPKAIGSYSQAVLLDNKLLFVSGQIPVDPTTGKLFPGDIKELTKVVLDHIESILESAGSSLQKVVKVEVFLTDLNGDFPAFNEEYTRRFETNTVHPARQTIGVQALPMGSPIEISCIASG